MSPFNKTLYHSTQNLAHTVGQNRHFFSLPANTTIDVQVSNPNRVPGTVQLLNSSGAIVFDGTCGQGGTITGLPAGQYRWNIIGGPSSPLAGTVGHVAVVQDH
jgi:hypothetical protein